MLPGKKLTVSNLLVYFFYYHVKVRFENAGIVNVLIMNAENGWLKIIKLCTFEIILMMNYVGNCLDYDEECLILFCKLQNMKIESNS